MVFIFIDHSASFDPQLDHFIECFLNQQFDYLSMQSASQERENDLSYDSRNVYCDLLMLHCSIAILFMHLPFISSKDSLLYIAIPLIRLPYQSL